MAKTLFLGDSFYTWTGMKHFLRGTPLFVDMVYCSSSTFDQTNILSLHLDYIIINPGKADFLKYAKIIRNIPLNHTATLIVITDPETFTIFQTICGMRMQFLDQDQSLDALFKEMTYIINNKKYCKIRKLPNKITINEFNVMVMYSRGWSLSKIAGAAHKSEKTISSYKNNIAKKLGRSNARLKYMISNFTQM